MARYRTRPVEVDAIRYTGDNADEVIEFTDRNAYRDYDGTVEVLTGESDETAAAADPVAPGEWVVRLPGGTFVVCSVDEFEAMFEPAG